MLLVNGFAITMHEHGSNLSSEHDGIMSMYDMYIMHGMHGMYGSYAMTQDSTGTAWEPESTRMPSIAFNHHDWMVMIVGFANLVYDHQSGPRGGKKTFLENMFMITAQKDLDDNIFAVRFMFDVEPGTIGPCGYPLLLQTGETCDGITPLIDRQHPHDAFMELAAVYTHLLSTESSLFLYFGIPGEPALGPPTFMHRFSAFFNPEAPITHHWLDSTHITFGVATIGFIYDVLKIDASVFTGREPDQHRWNFDRPRFDSYSIRFSVNPTENCAAQISYGFLKSPEQLEPCVNTHRITASLIYNKQWCTNNWQTTFAWGLNSNKPGKVLNGFMVESAVALEEKHTIFGRAEYVQKDELFLEPSPCAGTIFNVGKIDAGYIYEYPLFPLMRWGLGAVVSASFVPKSIQRCYGGTPISYMIFLRAEYAV